MNDYIIYPAPSVCTTRKATVTALCAACLSEDKERHSSASYCPCHKEQGFFTETIECPFCNDPAITTSGYAFHPCVLPVDYPEKWEEFLTDIKEANMNAKRIKKAVATTKDILPVYWKSTLEQRLSTGAGSVTTYSDPKALEDALLSAHWMEYSHPSIMEGCTAFLTEDISGYLGVVSLSDLPEDQEVTLDDRKGTGKVSAIVNGIRGKMVYKTIIILGDEQGREVVFTFHPGNPVKPSQVTTEPGMHGKKITVREAMELGLTTAKIG